MPLACAVQEGGGKAGRLVAAFVWSASWETVLSPLSPSSSSERRDGREGKGKGPRSRIEGGDCRTFATTRT